jgi:signal-transduction protein with cAMP-binding, CBS, and nucleotidyltransferase domain
MTNTTPGSSVVTRISELRLGPAVTVTPDLRIDQVARIMRAHDVSALVVGEPGDPVAIVTERDLTQAMADRRPVTDPVATIDSDNPITIAHDATVMEAATLMLREGLRHLVVTRGRRVTGVVSIRDALATLVTAVTPDTVFVRLARVSIDPPELWLG